LAGFSTNIRWRELSAVPFTQQETQASSLSASGSPPVEEEYCKMIRPNETIIQFEDNFITDYQKILQSIILQLERERREEALNPSTPWIYKIGYN